MATTENATSHSPVGSIAEKGGGIDEIESVPVYSNLSSEDAQWLAAFPQERQKKVIRKVCYHENGSLLCQNALTDGFLT